MGITERIEEKINVLQEKLKTTNKTLEDSSPENIWEFLNHHENICTPGFILRKQLQIKFPKIVRMCADKSGVKNYADLLNSGNVKWDSNFIEVLSKKLSEMPFKKFLGSPLNIEMKQWKNYLNDSARCQRNTAIKLIFALQMDELTRAKFLLANGHELLSLRNPFDYACKVCLDCKFTYDEAEILFNEFDKSRDKTQYIDETQESPDDDFTQRIKDETEELIKQDIISFEDFKDLILAKMLEYQKSFRLNRNESGYSFRNMERFKILLKYLTLLYPKMWFLSKKDEFNQVDIKKNEDGTPKTPQHLINAMLESQEIDLPEYVELSEYGGPHLEERGTAKRLYDNIPFTKNVLIPLRSLSKNIRAILRAIKNPENSSAVSRDTVLFLTYFLITGWLFAEDEHKEKILEELNDDIQTSEDGKATAEMLYILEEILEALDDISENEKIPAEKYILLINRILTPFEFIEFYAPFVLDRFILICLMSLKYFDKEYLMPMIIAESYRLSLDFMQKEEAVKNGRI